MKNYDNTLPFLSITHLLCHFFMVCFLMNHVPRQSTNALRSWAICAGHSGEARYRVVNHLVVSWMRWQGRGEGGGGWRICQRSCEGGLRRFDRRTYQAALQLPPPAELQSKWALIDTAIVEVAVARCGQKG